MKIKKNLFLKLFTVLCLFILISCGSSLERPKSNTDYKNIIGKPIKIGNLEIAQYDYPEVMYWEDAKKACEALGQGWRLPTKDELNSLYLSKDKIGGFAGNYYWSSTEDIDDNMTNGNYGAWTQGFSNLSNGRTNVAQYNDYGHSVRAIRAF